MSEPHTREDAAERGRLERQGWRSIPALDAVALWARTARESLEDSACGHWDDSAKRQRIDWILARSCEIFWRWGRSGAVSVASFAASMGNQASAAELYPDGLSAAAIHLAGWAELGRRSSRGALPFTYSVGRSPKLASPLEHASVRAGMEAARRSSLPRLRLARSVHVSEIGPWAELGCDVLDAWCGDRAASLARAAREEDLGLLKMGATFEAASFISWAIDSAELDWTSWGAALHDDGDFSLIVGQISALVEAELISDMAQGAADSAPRRCRVAL